MIFSVLPMSSFAQSDAIIGEYWTEDKTGKIAIYKCKSKYCGRISWRKDNRKDHENPDKSKRNRNVIGIEFLSNCAEKWG